MGLRNHIKDPDEVLDYSLDWSGWLGTDTIASSDWTVESGLTKDSQSNSSDATTVWISGGTAGTTYRLTNRITTVAGRTAERSITITVATR